MTTIANAPEIRPGDEIRTQSGSTFTVHTTTPCTCTEHYPDNPEHYRLMPETGPGMIATTAYRIPVLNRTQGELENRAYEENEARIAAEIETKYAELMYRIDELADLSGRPYGSGIAYELYQRLQHRERGGYSPAS